MANQKLPEPVLKGIIEYAAKLRAEIEQAEKTITKAKEDLAAREALAKSMRAELGEVDAFVKVNAPARKGEAVDDAVVPWIYARTDYLEIAKRSIRNTHAFKNLYEHQQFSEAHMIGDSVDHVLPINYYRASPRAAAGMAKKAVVLDIAMQMMRDGKRVSTADISERLKDMGVDLEVANAQTRISQILSEDDRFIAIRGLGWALKGEDPAGTGSSSAT